jgi:outer membrane protein TolC
MMMPLSRPTILLWLTIGSWCATSPAAQAPSPAASASAPFNIDLPTALRLAHADNIDVQLARERINEARANHASAVEKFLPWVTVGASYRRHEGRTQAVDGTLLDVDKQSASIGPTLTAQIDFGDAWFSTLAAKQTVTAADAALQAQQQQATFKAASGYFELLKAKALVDAARESLTTSEAYEQQLQAGFNAGVIFKGDWLRVQTQTQRYQSAVLQAQQQQRLASAQLAQILHLDPTVELAPQDGDLLPIALMHADSQTTLVQQALEGRAELRQSQAQLQAARTENKGALYGPLFPSLGVQAFVGEFGGGPDRAGGNFAGSRDYYLGLNWRFGPGGLFDFGRGRATRSKVRSAELSLEKATDTVKREVVEAQAKVAASMQVLTASSNSLAAATETLRLTRDRKQLGVGIVLEDIQAQQELLRAREDYLNAITDHNKAQYQLSEALGSL